MKEKHTIDESYFEKIDTPNKAYFLGLFYADGSINKRDRTIINLQEGDSSVLEKLRIDMKSTKPLEYRKRKLPRKDQKALVSYNHKIASDLRKLGLHEAKTKSIEFPNYIPYDLMIHFVRGYFDGDGWIHLSKKYAVTLGIICLDNFAVGLKNFFDSLDIDSKIILYREDKYTINNLVHIDVGKKKHIYKLMNLMYNNTNMYIERKYKKYEQAFLIEERHLYEKYTSNFYTGIDGNGGRPVLKLDVNNNIIKEYRSIHEVERLENIGSQSVFYHCLKYKNNNVNTIDLSRLFCYKEDYNSNHKFILNRSRPSKSKKKVQQLNLNNDIIKVWNYISETKNYGFDPSVIVKCCKGKLNTHKGFKWKYFNNN